MTDLNKPKYFDVDRLYWYLQNNDTPECKVRLAYLCERDGEKVFIDCSTMKQLDVEESELQKFCEYKFNNVNAKNICTIDCCPNILYYKCNGEEYYLNTTYWACYIPYRNEHLDFYIPVYSYDARFKLNRMASSDYDVLFVCEVDKDVYDHNSPKFCFEQGDLLHLPDMINKRMAECIKAGILKASELKPEPEKHESPEALKKAEDQARAVEQYLVR